jgi:hypothetical protein
MNKIEFKEELNRLIEKCRENRNKYEKKNNSKMKNRCDGLIIAYEAALRMFDELNESNNPL